MAPRARLTIVAGYASWRMWIAPPPAPGDLWAYSDRLRYDGDIQETFRPALMLCARS
jgi:hypothetical protein